MPSALMGRAEADRPAWGRPRARQLPGGNLVMMARRCVLRPRARAGLRGRFWRAAAGRLSHRHVFGLRASTEGFTPLSCFRWNAPRTNRAPLCKALRGI